MSTILCCLCGTSIIANDAAMCIRCLSLQFKISDVIDGHNEITQCRKCGRWSTGRDHWMACALESAGLLGICLKKIDGLQRMKIIDALWVWTEPHSNRLKVSVEVERGVLEDKIKLREKVLVEFVINHKQCLDCARDATDHNWGAMIQLRQKVGHHRALNALERKVLKADVGSTIMNAVLSKEGIDLYFKTKKEADKCVVFITSRMPAKVKSSKKLISRDLHENTYRHEYTTNIEIAPLCKGDLVITSKAVVGFVDLMLVTNLSASIHLISPLSAREAEIAAVKYFAKPLHVILSAARHLTPYTVLDVQPVAEGREKNASLDDATVHPTTTGDDIVNEGIIGKIRALLAEAEVSREKDFGVNDHTICVRTHLGHVLQAGDSVLGYDLAHAVIEDELLAELRYDRPDAILVKKTYDVGSKERTGKKRAPGKNHNKSTPDSPFDDGKEHDECFADEIEGDFEEDSDDGECLEEATNDEILNSIGSHDADSKSNDHENDEVVGKKS